MIWYEIKILSTTEASDAISDMLVEFGAKGVSILDPQEVRFLNDNPQLHHAPDFLGFEEKFMSDLGEDVIIKAYFSDLSDIPVLRDAISEKILNIANFLPIGKGKVEVSQVDEEDWATSWKKYYKPLKISERIVIKPTWEAYEPTEGEVVIELDPGMAFGTGTHETTAMCLKLLDEFMPSGVSIIDVGCGTGILGIAAAKLGAKKVSAYDIDEISVRISKENAKINDVSDIVTVSQNDLLAGITEPCDIIVANIIADIIIRMVDSAHKLLKINGLFIVSGIIHKRADAVENALKDNGFVIEKKIADGEWAAFVARRG